MDSRLQDVILRQVDSLKADTEKKFDKVDERFDKIENKIDQLLAFKWQIIGGSAAVSLVLTMVIQLMFIWLEKRS